MNDFNYKADVILKNIAETWKKIFFCWDTLFLRLLETSLQPK